MDTSYLDHVVLEGHDGALDWAHALQLTRRVCLDGVLVDPLKDLLRARLKSGGVDVTLNTLTVRGVVLGCV